MGDAGLPDATPSLSNTTSSLSDAKSSLPYPISSSPVYIDYANVPGYFLQSDASTDPNAFDYSALNFGLADCTYDTDAKFDPYHQKTQWQRFEHKVLDLNRNSGNNIRYKVLYMGRHGEGYHNVGQVTYEEQDWLKHWSTLDGNGTMTWADAHLTEKGIGQCLAANAFWAREIASEKIPMPETYYVSPLHRCLETAKFTFSGLQVPSDRPFAPEVKELLREQNGFHTDTRRSSKSHIEAHFPGWRIEPGFAEEDELWTAESRETEHDLDIRMKKLLDDIFAHDESTFISFTTHSGSIASILRIMGHQVFGLRPGHIIPVLVRAESGVLN